MNILMLCAKYSLVEADGWLTNELADEFAKSGHFVQVVCIDWNSKPGAENKTLVSSSGVRIASVSPFLIKRFGGGIQKSLKWLLSSLKARAVSREITENRQFDLIIAFSPAVTIMAALLKILKFPGIRSYFILWDFFPYHHQQIGLIKNRAIFLIAKKIEEYILRKFDFIACMSQMNVDYLRSHYDLRPIQKTPILSLWGNQNIKEPRSEKNFRIDFGLPEEKTIAVFGGQLTVGRGIEEILSVAQIAQRVGDDIVFLFVGNGSYLEEIRNCITKGVNNIIVIDWVPRNQYLRLLSVCDIALVCTVRNVDVPTFPSKTIDYFRASLPVAASVESCTDYGDWIVERGAGCCSEAGDALAFYKNIKTMSDDPQLRFEMGKNGNACLSGEMNVSNASRAILTSIQSIDRIS